MNRKERRAQVARELNQGVGKPTVKQDTKVVLKNSAVKANQPSKPVTVQVKKPVQKGLPTDRISPVRTVYYHSRGESVETIVRQEVLREIREQAEKLKTDIEKSWNDIFAACKKDTEFFNTQFISMANKKVWMDRKLLALYPNPEGNFKWGSINDGADVKGSYQSADKNWIKNYSRSFEGFDFRPPTKKELIITFTKDNPHVNEDGTIDFLTQKSCGHSQAYNSQDQYTYRFYHENWLDADGSGYRDNWNYFRDRYYYKKFLIFKNKDERTGALFLLGNHDYDDEIKDESSSNLKDDFFALLPIHRLSEEIRLNPYFGKALCYCLANELIPTKLPKEVLAIYKKLIDSYKKWNHYISLKGLVKGKDEYSSLAFDLDLFMKEVESGTFKGKIGNYSCDLEQKLTSDKGQILLDHVTNQLCEDDYERANQTRYDKKSLTDENAGSWELFEDHSGSNFIPVTLPEGSPSWMARPPQKDIKEDGICAIDFGTKSTTVVCRYEEGGIQEKLLRIGKGDLTQEPKREDYENPTAITLRDVESFNKDYKSREGRPFTRWKDMAAAHQAADDLFSEGASDLAYYSVFNELKQWANDPGRHMMLKDRLGHEQDLKPFMEIQKGDFDPIEIYAYYLGLNINTMVRGIFLDYIMSFPVNYDTKVRKNIRESFERGLRKSLPTAILNDKELMERFSIQEGCSEPAAYAMAALKELGLEPEEEGKAVAYAVFDFGGGTTDFDYGIERISTKRRWNYDIIHFNHGGDDHLGGENLLALMAYQVFKDNKAKMRSQNIHIILPFGAERFSGSEVIVEDRLKAKQAAYMNMRILQKELRPLWENTDSVGSKYDKPLPVNLYSSKTQKKEKVDITVKKDVLLKLLEEKIAVGVDSFFSGLWEAFKNEKLKEENISTLHILLAGNSSKSPIVKKLMDKEVKKYIDLMKKEQGMQLDLELHLPLGMNESKPVTPSAAAADLNKTKVIASVPGHQNKGKSSVDTVPADKDAQSAGKSAEQPEVDFEKEKTGKTGVAFGLLRCRQGAGDIRVINQDEDKDVKEIKFPYLLGVINRHGGFDVVIDRDVPYNQWALYIDAMERSFELRYTKDFRALEKGKLSDKDVHSKRCYIDQKEVSEEDDVNVYIRKVGSNSVEYAVARDEDMEAGKAPKHVYPKVILDKK